MIAPDSFSQYYAPLLENTYDVVDRIVLNAYFSLGSSAGGFRLWWQRLHGTDDNLDDTHLMRMAGRFARRVRGWGKKRNVPVVFCPAGERKHVTIEPYLPADPSFRGIFAVQITRAPAPVWEVLRSPNGGFHLRRKKSMPYVNHYSFHILDEEWGHVTIKVCGQPPFKAMVMLNGHEYTACRARRAHIAFGKEGNCFTEVSNAAALAKVADTLRSPTAIGRLRRVCERWIYHCVCFGLSFEEQKRSGFHHRYSLFQIEYSRNLLFTNGHEMEQVFHGVIDRTRSLLDIRTVKTIFGIRLRRRVKRHDSIPRFECLLESPVYDLTVFKVHLGRLTLKVYTKGECVLRIEAIAHHVDDLRCRRGLDCFGEALGKLAEILGRFLNVLRCVDVSWISDRLLEDLPMPSVIGRTRVGGVDINKPRIRAVMEAAIALSLTPGGFTAAQHADKVGEILGLAAQGYAARHAAYDLKKLRAKGLIRKTAEGSRRYEATPDGLQAMACLIVLREKVIKPLLHHGGHRKAGRRPAGATELDLCYEAVQGSMKQLFKTLGIAA
ncbi:MAG: hypothetical protein V1790_03590 [Planctomycetota bacterium]